MIIMMTIVIVMLIISTLMPVQQIAVHI
jgi:hypothetical protein